MDEDDEDDDEDEDEGGKKEGMVRVYREERGVRTIHCRSRVTQSCLLSIVGMHCSLIGYCSH